MNAHDLADALALAKFFRRLQSVETGIDALDIKVYRTVACHYAKPGSLITGEGALRHGGRWNPKGLRTVYASLDPAVALAESLANYSRFDAIICDALPSTNVQLHAVLGRVLSLSDDVLRHLDIERAVLLGTDWKAEMQAGRVPVTHYLGVAAYACAFHGIIAPSAAVPNGRNIVMFPENFNSSCSLNIVNVDKLPG